MVRGYSADFDLTQDHDTCPTSLGSLKIDDKTCQQIIFPSTTQPFSKSLLLLRIPPPRELLYSEYLLEHHPPVSKVTPPALRKAFTTTDLIDFQLQFSKDDFFDSRSQLCHQLIPPFEHCNRPCSRAQLQMAAEITPNNQEHYPSSYGEIPTCKCCSYGDS